jgi:hypothetical protein
MECQRFSKSPGVATGSEAAAGQISPPRPPAPEGATASAATRVRLDAEFVEGLDCDELD